jgi:hypothetical protein
MERGYIQDAAPYEYRPIPRLGVLGSVAVALIVGFGVLIGGKGGDVSGDLELQAGVAVAVAIGTFFAMLLIGQNLYWAIEEEGISWRSVSGRRRRVSWEEIACADIVWIGRGASFRSRALQLRRRDGRRLVVRPSRRYGESLEPDALRLLEEFASRYGFDFGWREAPDTSMPAEPPAREHAASLPGQTSLLDER